MVNFGSRFATQPCIIERYIKEGVMSKKNPVVHFEMPYKDAQRVSAFYRQAFGWDMVDTGEQMGNYITAGTAETNENRMVQTPGTINGGFYSLSSAPQS